MLVEIAQGFPSSKTIFLTFLFMATPLPKVRTDFPTASLSQARRPAAIHPLHPRDVAPRLRVPHVDVPHLLPREQPLDGGVHLAVRDPLPGHDPAVGTVGFEGQGQVAEASGGKAF